MKRAVMLAWSSLFAISVPVVRAQAPLTLGDAAAAVLRVHPTMAAAEAALARAESGEREARSALLPSLQLEGSAMRFEEPMVVAPLHGFDPTRPPLFDNTLYQGAASLSYTLFDGGARRARIGRAGQLADAAEAGAAAAAQALLVQLSQSYLRVLANRELVAAHRARVEAVGSERVRAAQLFEQGRAARLVLLRADAALSSAGADTVNATSQLETAERTLARLLAQDPAALRGRPLGAVRSDVSPPADRAAALRASLERNAEVQRAKAQVAAAERTRREAAAAWLPRLQLAGRYVEYGSSHGRQAGEWQGGLQLGYPLFTGGARAAVVDRAQAELAAARAELAALELRLADAVDAALTSWAAAHARVAALGAVLGQAEEVARVEQLALRQGAGVQSDYLLAEAEVFRARASLAEARYAEVGARVELARATGELSVQWLHENVEMAP